MSPSIREPADEQPIDLGTGVDRRLLMAAAGLGVVALTALVLVGVFAKTDAATENEGAPVQRTASPPREKAIPLLPLATSQSRPQDNLPPDPPAIVVKDPAPAETPKPAPKPEVVIVKPVAVPVAPVVKRPPASPEPAQVDQTPEPPTFKRIHPYGEEELRKRLAEESREVDIGKETTKKLLDEAMKDARAQARLKRSEDGATAGKELLKPSPKDAPIIEIVAQRGDLKGLPIRSLSNCQASGKEAETMDELSREARRTISKTRGRRVPDRSSSQSNEPEFQLMEFVRNAEWDDDVGVRMLVQMFQTESYGVRRQMIKTLAKNKAKSAGPALARIAVFDLNPAIRESAVEALDYRPRTDSRPTLLEALRHPWPPVADHAAEALVALKDRKAAFDLARLLDEPDPRAPTKDKENKWMKPELVRVNHLANCLLCHAPDTGGLVRGLVPERGQPIPEAYYESRSGSFIRADVTYLKQDFSVMQSVPEPNKWPAMQRFDYLVRMRELTADEVSHMIATKDAEDANAPTYPQRVAVRWALRQLTGKDKGAHSADWEECLQDARTTADP